MFLRKSLKVQGLRETKASNGDRALITANGGKPTSRMINLPRKSDLVIEQDGISFG